MEKHLKYFVGTILIAAGLVLLSMSLMFFGGIALLILSSKIFAAIVIYVSIVSLLTAGIVIMFT